jgi:hypothetical protein
LFAEKNFLAKNFLNFEMQGKFLEWNENNCLVPQDVSKETVARNISYNKVWAIGGTEIWYVLSYPVLIRDSVVLVKYPGTVFSNPESDPYRPVRTVNLM